MHRSLQVVPATFSFTISSPLRCALKQPNKGAHEKPDKGAHEKPNE